MRKNIIKKVMAALMCGSLFIGLSESITLAQDIQSDSIPGESILQDEREYIYGDFAYERDSVESYGICITGYTGKKKELKIPEEINGIKVVRVRIDGENGFSETVKKVRIPETRQIKSISFEACDKLESVNIPEGVESIGDCAFRDCISLKKIKIPSSVKIIYQNAFEYSGLEEVDMENGITFIDREAFLCCRSLKSIVIPNTVHSIGARAFKGCINLKKVTLPKKFESIGSMAFSNTGLKSITIGRCYSIGTCAFEECDYLEKVKFEEGLKYIYGKAFNECKRLKNVKIPKSTVYIYNAFDKNTKVFLKSPYMKKYIDGKKRVYIKGVEIKVKGKYCYKEVKDILDQINKDRKTNKFKSVSISYNGLRAAMERAVYLGVANNLNKRPNYTKYKNKISGYYVISEIGGNRAKKRFINKILNDREFKKIKTIGIGCVQTGSEKIYFAVAGEKNKDKIIKKIYNDRSFIKNIAVRGDCINKISGKNTTIKVGKSLKVIIKAKLTEKSPYYMNDYSAGRITMNNLKIKSLNKKIVKTDKKGVITGVKRGTAKLKVSLKMNGKCSTVIKVKVV